MKSSEITRFSNLTTRKTSHCYNSSLKGTNLPLEAKIDGELESLTFLVNTIAFGYNTANLEEKYRERDRIMTSLILLAGSGIPLPPQKA
jgi:hypothetical protein